MQGARLLTFTDRQLVQTEAVFEDFADASG